MAEQQQKPQCRLVGTDGNVFAVIGAVSKALKQAGLSDQAEEFTHKAMSASSYEEILGGLVFEYVEVT